MTAREYKDVRKRLLDSVRTELVEGAKHRHKFHSDAASYAGVHVVASSILLDVLSAKQGVADVVAKECVRALNRRVADEADSCEAKAADLREAIVNE